MPDDPELSALPAPERPWRRATLASLAVLSVAAGVLAWRLAPEASYALGPAVPAELGPLQSWKPSERLINRWVHGTGELSAAAVTYRRPLEPDSFILSPLQDNPRLWVQLRHLELEPGQRFVPPRSFVGRLIPLDAPQLRYSALRAALDKAGLKGPPQGAWLLIDGEAPRTSRWALAVVGLLLSFVGFACWGMVTLLKPAPKPATLN